MHDIHPTGEAREAREAFIAIDQIFVGEARQRKNPNDAKPLLDLKRGILSKGLFHPIILAHRVEPAEGEPKLQLVAGERRLLAIRELHEDGLQFMFNGSVVPPNTIPYTLLGELSPADLEEAELEENILRLQLPWHEEAEAKLKIHELRRGSNPDQRLIDTAQEIIEKSGKDTTVLTEKFNLVMAETVAPYKHLPAVQQAKSLRKAYNVVLDQKKALIARQLRKLNTKTSQHKLLLGDFLDVCKDLPKNHFDVIIADPPYGIDAHQQSFEKRHDYDDSRLVSLRFYQEIFRKGFHLLKPQGHLFLFCDVEHFITIRTYAEQQAFSTWRTPIIWFKGPEGPAPWGKNGFCRTYEMLLFATKGQRPLCIGPESDVHLAKRVTRTDRKHAAEKPPELLRWLLQLTCTPGTDCKVLDPCAGSGPLLEAAKNLDIELTLIERSEEYYNTLCLRAQEVEQEDEVLPDQVEHAFSIEDLEDDIFK